MQGTDNRRTCKLEEGLAGQFSLGINSYPYNLSNATNIINNYKNYVNNPNHYGKKKQKSKKDSDKVSDKKITLIKK